MLVGRLDGGVYVNAHWLPDNAHVLELKIPPAPLSLQDIVPIIDEEGFELSTTEAVRVFALPEVSVVGLAVTVVVV